jgi:UDP-GlcNAc:undecaprenyl-phosphate GlcNAc-1-phosphate transferase
MMYYIVLVFILFVSIQGYFRIAMRYGITDHSLDSFRNQYLVIRGAGIIFPLSVFIWWVCFHPSADYFLLALFLVTGVSFVDDIVTVAPQIRLVVHFVAAVMLFHSWPVLGAHHIFLAILVYLSIAAWLNAFNFMDGINGLAGSYSIVSFASFLLINSDLTLLDNRLLCSVLVAAFLFTFYNFRGQARCFAGDVGSISMALILAYVMLQLLIRTEHIPFLLFFLLFALDVFYTLVHRLLRRENIFEPHRFHVYQLLTYSLHNSPLKVSAGIAVLQLMLNGLVWLNYSYRFLSGPIFFLLVLLLSSGGYLWLRIRLLDKIARLQTRNG